MLKFTIFHISNAKYVTKHVQVLINFLNIFTQDNILNTLPQLARKCSYGSKELVILSFISLAKCKQQRHFGVTPVTARVTCLNLLSWRHTVKYDQTGRDLVQGFFFIRLGPRAPMHAHRFFGLNYFRRSSSCITNLCNSRFILNKKSSSICILNIHLVGSRRGYVSSPSYCPRGGGAK